MSLDGDYLDASDMRQVPDNQEVLLSRTTNVSVIVEVLQCVAAHTSVDGMRQGVHDHFDSLAHDNSAQHTNCLLYTSPSPRDLSTSRMPSSA